MWIFFGPCLGYLNPSWGLIHWRLSCETSWLIQRPWLKGTPHETLIREYMVLMCLVAWPFMLGLLETLIYGEVMLYYHIMHHPLFIWLHGGYLIWFKSWLKHLYVHHICIGHWLRSFGISKCIGLYVLIHYIHVVQLVRDDWCHSSIGSIDSILVFCSIWIMFYLHYTWKP